VVIWDLEPEDDLARVRMARGGPMPETVALTAAPFQWAWEEKMAMRLDSPPAWAPGAPQVWLAPLEGRGDVAQVLSVEFPMATVAPSLDALEEEAAFLGTVLRIQ